MTLCATTNTPNTKIPTPEDLFHQTDVTVRNKVLDAIGIALNSPEAFTKYLHRRPHSTWLFVVEVYGEFNNATRSSIFECLEALNWKVKISGGVDENGMSYVIGSNSEIKDSTFTDIVKEVKVDNKYITVTIGTIQQQLIDKQKEI